MADNLAVTPGVGASIAADDVGGVLYQRVKLTWGPDGIGNDVDIASGKMMPVQLRSSTGVDLIKAGSTLPAATDPALVVTIRDANVNLSDGTLQTTAAHTGAPVVGLDPYSQYKFAGSGATTVMGAAGAQYDYLAGVLIVPGTAAAGAVSIQDGNGSSIQVFPGGGTTALADLKPFLVPLGIYALAATTPGWRIINGTNVTAIGIGKFT